MLHRFQRIAPRRSGGTLIVCGLLSACATLTSGSRQILNISSDPAEATCTLTREGRVIGMVGPTPGQVVVDKDNAPIAVTCTKPGYQEARGTLSSSFDGATLGNVLLGGVIGIIADLQTGATAKYETTLQVRLYRGDFADERERDAYFDKLRDGLRAPPDAGPGDPAAAARKELLEDLERKRSAAHITGRGPS